ncbi:MAG: ABC transporter substrate-binding protein [Actinomycetota bacterium]|nr:ABC transporter substrate-binding protein [Actinomycetota bacterium]
MLTRAFAAVAALALLAGACAGQQERRGEEGAPKILSTYIGEPEHLLTTNSSESEGGAVLAALYTGLIEFDPRTTEPFNAVAESIETADSTHYRIKLKPGWTFHNGEPVTANSFVDAWNFGAHANNAQQNSNFFEKIAGFAQVNPPDPDQDGPLPAPPPTADSLSGLMVVDDLTFEVTLSEPFSQFPLVLGYQAFAPLPRAAFEDPQAFEQAPIGNGPFMMDGAWEHNVEIRTKAHPDYAGPEKPRVDGITFRIYADVNTAYNDLLAGTLDVVDDLPPERVAEARQTLGERFGESPEAAYNYLGFPLYLPMFQNKALRHALSMAVDREAIVSTIFNGTRLAAHSYVAPTIPGHRPNACAETTRFDPQRARQLFQQAGGWQGPMTIWFNSGAGHDAWVEAVANMWRQHLGISDISFQQLPFAEYLPKTREKGMTGPFRLGWVMDYPSPQNFLEKLYATEALPPGGSNSVFYSNSEFDRLIEEGNRQRTLQDSIPFYQRAEDILCEDMPTAPMFYNKNSYGSSERVENLYVDGFGRINYIEVELK